MNQHLKYTYQMKLRGRRNDSEGNKQERFPDWRPEIDGHSAHLGAPPIPSDTWTFPIQDEYNIEEQLGVTGVLIAGIAAVDAGHQERIDKHQE